MSFRALLSQARAQQQQQHPELQDKQEQQQHGESSAALIQSPSVPPSQHREPVLPRQTDAATVENDLLSIPVSAPSGSVHSSNSGSYDEKRRAIELLMRSSVPASPVIRATNVRATSSADCLGVAQPSSQTSCGGLGEDISSKMDLSATAPAVLKSAMLSDDNERVKSELNPGTDRRGAGTDGLFPLPTAILQQPRPVVGSTHRDVNVSDSPQLPEVFTEPRPTCLVKYTEQSGVRRHRKSLDSLDVVSAWTRLADSDSILSICVPNEANRTDQLVVLNDHASLSPLEQYRQTLTNVKGGFKLRQGQVVDAAVLDWWLRSKAKETLDDIACRLCTLQGRQASIVNSDSLQRFAHWHALRGSGQFDASPNIKARHQSFTSFGRAYQYLAQRAPAVRESLMQTERAYAQVGQALRAELVQQRRQLASTQQVEMQAASDASDPASISILVAKHVYEVERLEKQQRRQVDDLNERQRLEFVQFVLQFAQIEGASDSESSLLKRLEQQRAQLEEANARKAADRQAREERQRIESGEAGVLLSRRKKLQTLQPQRRRDGMFDRLTGNKNKRRGELGVQAWQPQPASTQFKVFGEALRQELRDTITVMLRPQDRLPGWCIACEKSANLECANDLMESVIGETCSECGNLRPRGGNQSRSSSSGIAGALPAGLPPPPPFCNIRVTAVPLLNVCTSDKKEDHQLMASALYTESANSGSDGGSGVVLLAVDPLLKCYSADLTTASIVGASTASAFADLCGASTEFHFEPLQTQLKHVRQEFADPMFGEPLRIGDFFITQHSNLCNVHAAFHIVGEDSAVTSGRDTGMALNPQSNLLAGLQRALHAAIALGAGFIALPALLLAGAAEGMVSAEMMDVQQRAAQVVACVSKFLREEPVNDLTNIIIALPNVPGVASLQTRLREQLKAEFPDVHASSW